MAEPSRPSVLMTWRGSGGDGVKSILFNGHIDTVRPAGYIGEGLSDEVQDNSIR